VTIYNHLDVQPAAAGGMAIFGYFYQRLGMLRA
jgi:hypothetical protein